MKLVTLISTIFILAGSVYAYDITEIGIHEINGIEEVITSELTINDSTEAVSSKVQFAMPVPATTVNSTQDGWVELKINNGNTTILVPYWNK